MRSCYAGYWRFFGQSPTIITPGYYRFVDDDTPHLGDFHYFGSADWQQGDEPEVVGEPQAVKLGNDLSIGREYYDGFNSQTLFSYRTVGNPRDFTRSVAYDPEEVRALFNGVDVRCYNKQRPCYIDNLLFFNLRNCAFLLVMMQLLREVGNEENAIVSTFLTTLLGPGTDTQFSPPTDDHPPYCVSQTARNNLIIIYGTHTWNLLQRQITQSITGTTRYGDYNTLQLWWDHATHIVNFCNARGVDWSKPTFIVGHSFGGAVAYNLWWRLYDASRSRVIRVITGGCPKPGDRTLADRIRLFCIHVSIWNDQDIVPGIPPDEEMKAALQARFPFLPDRFFNSFKPLDEYLHVGAGGQWRFGPYESPSLETYGRFFATDIFLAGGPGIRRHWPRAYVDRLALHCPDPEPPFDADCYNQLFSTDRFSNGGPALGGDGNADRDRGAGVVFGGAGELDGDLGAGVVLDGEGELDGDLGVGLELDGEGELDGELGAGVELGGSGSEEDAGVGVVFGGEGEIAIVPGTDCSSAAEIALGDSYDGSISSGPGQQWFKIPVVDSEEMHVSWTITSGTPSASVGHGTSCPPSFVGFLNTITTCVEHTPSEDEFVYVQVSGPLMGTATYTLTSGAGGC